MARTLQKREEILAKINASPEFRAEYKFPGIVVCKGKDKTFSYSNRDSKKENHCEFVGKFALKDIGAWMTKNGFVETTTEKVEEKVG